MKIVGKNDMKQLLNAVRKMKFPRKSQERWDKMNMRTASCRLRTDAYEQFRRLCEKYEVTPHRLLRSYIAHLLRCQYGDDIAESLKESGNLYLYMQRATEDVFGVGKRCSL